MAAVPKRLCSFTPPSAFFWVKALLIIELAIYSLYTMYVMMGIASFCWPRTINPETNVAENLFAQLLHEAFLFVVILAYLIQMYLVYTLCLAIKEKSTHALDRWFTLRAVASAIMIAGITAHIVVFREVYLPALAITAYFLCGLNMVHDYKKSILLARASRRMHPIQPLTIVMPEFRKAKTSPKKPKKQEPGPDFKIQMTKPEEMV